MVGYSCGNVRLSLGRKGILQVYVNGEWGNVCDDNFDENTNGANVVCKELFNTAHSSFGSTSSGKTLPEEFKTSEAQPGSDDFKFDDVQCTGSESSIHDCIHQGYAGNCNVGETIWIICQ